MRPCNGESAGDLGQQLLGGRPHLLTPHKSGKQVALLRMALLGLGDLAACEFEHRLKGAGHLPLFWRVVSGSSMEQRSSVSVTS